MKKDIIRIDVEMAGGETFPIVFPDWVLPDWALFVAVDGDGWVSAFSARPEFVHATAEWVSSTRASELPLIHFVPRARFSRKSEPIAAAIRANCSRMVYRVDDVRVPSASASDVSELETTVARLADFSASLNPPIVTDPIVWELTTPDGTARASLSAARVPEWARFVAVDGDGIAYAYAKKPRFVESEESATGSAWTAIPLGSRCEPIGTVGVEVTNAGGTLREIPRRAVGETIDDVAVGNVLAVPLGVDGDEKIVTFDVVIDWESVPDRFNWATVCGNGRVKYWKTCPIPGEGRYWVSPNHAKTHESFEFAPFRLPSPVDGWESLIIRRPLPDESPTAPAWAWVGVVGGAQMATFRLLCSAGAKTARFPVSGIFSRALYAAVDRHGSLHAYESKPYANDSIGRWVAERAETTQYVGQMTYNLPVENWKELLVKVR